MRSQLRQLTPTLWELPAGTRAGMRVPGRLYADRLLAQQLDDGVLEQLANVAALPGIVGAALCMPDGHWGYGFPIGGAAATDPDCGGVISPGGVGFDLNCGMRLVRTDLTLAEVQPRLRQLIDALFAAIPTGVGAVGALRLTRDDLVEIVERGARWSVDHGFGTDDDLHRTEEGGCFPGASARHVSQRALDRGRDQVGTLGSGNHYLEVQVVHPGDVFDPEAAAAFGFAHEYQIAVMYHCGSRGFGHQVATDYLRSFVEVMGPRYGLRVPDRELACAPFDSPDGQAYYSAMKCAVNMSFANRQVILHRIRQAFAQVFGRSPADLGLRTVYDVSHNTARLETHTVDGAPRRLLVHRKGATRSLPPGSADIPAAYRPYGQPVIIGGSMETGSYLLAGTAGSEAALATTAHGAGRAMSRRQALQRWEGRALQRQLQERGIYVRTASWRGLAEEAGGAYKDVDQVVRVAAAAGLSRPVLRLRPLGSIKG